MERVVQPPHLFEIHLGVILTELVACIPLMMMSPSLYMAIFSAKRAIDGHLLTFRFKLSVFGLFKPLAKILLACFIWVVRSSRSV